MKRVMCIHLPKWPLQRLCREQPALRDKAVVLVQGQAVRGPQVIMASTRASSLGIRPGMPAAEALAILSQLHLQEENAESDYEALKHLASWAERYSPMVGLEDGQRPQGLFLDISGGATCFGGEERLLVRVKKELNDEGWLVRIAIADTPGAAWALARHGPPDCIAGVGETERFLRVLPLAALRLPADVLALFAALGIECIEQLMALPRSSLPARFGGLVLLRLDQALGQVSEVIVPHYLLPEIQAAHTFEYPAERVEQVHAVLDQLLVQIHRHLQERGLGARQMECWFHHEMAMPQRLEANFMRPSRSPAYLRSLLNIHLEQIQAAEPIQSIVLRVTLAEHLSDEQMELFETESLHREKLSRLVDSLSNRLGCEAVTRASLVPDAQPEYACRLEPVMRAPHPNPLPRGERGSSSSRRRKKALAASVISPRLFRRPLCLWPEPAAIMAVSVIPDGPPIRFRWAGKDYRISRAWGPERIETGWWRDDDVHRDYYVVTTHLGSRFWLFRRRDDGRWFIHGCFE